jgi:hypothetical protein
MIAAKDIGEGPDFLGACEVESASSSTELSTP